MKLIKFSLIAVIAGAVIVPGVAIAILTSGGTGSPPRSKAEATACISGWYIKCVGQELGLLASTDPMGALEMYRTKAENDTRIRESCHELFHAIGKGAAASTDKPWDVFMIGSGECNWGYIHGAVEGYLVGEASSVIERAEGLCVPPEGLDVEDPYIGSVMGNCVHGTGHALFHANEDPIEAEKGCREAFKRGAVGTWTALSCIDGMIMEFGNSDDAKAGMHSDICSRIGEDAKETCYKNIALTWYHQNDGNQLAVLNQCKEAGTEELIYTCTWGAGNLFTVQQGFDMPTMREMCLQLEGAYRRGCYTGAAVAAALGVNTGVLSETDLRTFVDSVPDAGLRGSIYEDVERAKGGFGAAA